MWKYSQQAIPPHSPSEPPGALTFYFSSSRPSLVDDSTRRVQIFCRTLRPNCWNVSWSFLAHGLWLLRTASPARTKSHP